MVMVFFILLNYGDFLLTKIGCFRLTLFGDYLLTLTVGDIKNNIIGIYHGVRKTDLPLFFGEQEYIFNHRNTGKQMMDKVAKYISKSYPMTRKQITNALNAAFPIFAQ